MSVFNNEVLLGS